MPATIADGVPVRRHRASALAWSATPALRVALTVVVILMVICHVLDVDRPPFLVALAAILSAAALPVLVARRCYLLAVTGFYLAGVLVIGIAAYASPVGAPGGILTADVLVDPVAPRALLALAAACGVFTVIALGSARNPALFVVGDADRRFCQRWATMATIVATLTVIATVRGALITALPYPFGVGEAGVGLRDAGLEAAGQIAFAFAFLIAVGGWQHDRRRMLVYGAILLFEIVFFRLLRGERGSVVGFAMCLLAWLHSTVRRWHKGPVLAAVGITAVVVLQMWPVVRGEAASVGLAQASRQGMEQLADDVASLDISRIQLLPQSFWHLLLTVDLYDSGIRRNGETYVNLAGQAVPAVLADWVGYVRPPNEAEELQRYRFNNGGSFVIAEGFWNFGFPGAVMIAAVLALLLQWLERWTARVAYPLRIAYLGVLMFLVSGLGYGIQGLVRAWEISALATLAVYALMRASRPRFADSRAAPDAVTR